MSDQNNSNAQQVQQRAGGGPAVTKGITAMFSRFSREPAAVPQ